MFYDACLKEFECLKDNLILTIIIVSPDWSMPFEVLCDSSGVVLSAVLVQRWEKILHPIYYVSKTLNPAPKKLHYDWARIACYGICVWHIFILFVERKWLCILSTQILGTLLKRRMENQDWLTSYFYYRNFTLWIRIERGLRRK